MKESATEAENTQNMDTSENEPTLEQNVENRVTGATTSDTMSSADVCQNDTSADNVDHQRDKNSLTESRLDNLSEGGQDDTENVCKFAEDSIVIPSDSKPNDSGDIAKKAMELVEVICGSKEGMRNSVDDMQITSDNKSRQLELNHSSSEETSVQIHDSANVIDNSSEHPSVSVSHSAAIAQDDVSHSATIAQDDKSDKLRIEESSPMDCSDSALVEENTGTMSTTENVDVSPVNEFSNDTDAKEDADVEKALHNEPTIQDEIVPDTEVKTFSDEDNTAADTVCSSENTVEMNNKPEHSGETQEPVVSSEESNKAEETTSVEEAATGSEVTEATAVNEKDSSEIKGDDLNDVSIYFRVANLIEPTFEKVQCMIFLERCISIFYRAFKVILT